MRFPAVGVLSVYCADAFETHKKCGLEPCRLCSGWHMRAHAVAPFMAVMKGRPWSAAAVAATTYTYISRLKHDLIHRYTAAADSTSQKSDIECTALCCVPTAVLPGAEYVVATGTACYNMGSWVRSPARTHTCRSTAVHGCHKGKSLKRGCCCTVATSKYTHFEGRCGTCS